MAVRTGIGSELRAVRLAAGLSVVEAARRAGVSRSAIHRWEAGESLPEIAGLDRLLKGLGAEPRTRTRILADAAPTPALPEVTNGPLGSPVHLGQALAAMRAGAGLGQAALARAAGVAQGTVAKWESGAFRPGDEALERVLAALRASEGDAAWVRGLAGEEPVPLGGLLDAKAWLDANRPISREPNEVAMLAFEREVWRQAARDARWEPLLVETAGARAMGHHYAACAFTPLRANVRARTAARDALALARRSGAWDEAVTALSIEGLGIDDPGRHDRFRAAALARVRSPRAQAHILHEWCMGIVDRARNAEPAPRERARIQAEGLVERAREFASDAGRPRNAVITLDHLACLLGTVRLRLGDPEEAIEAFEGASYIREADYAYEPIYANLYLMSLKKAGAKLPPRVVAAARRTHAEASAPSLRADWRQVARTLEIDP